MYHVHTEEQWNVQAALFYGNLLYFFDFLNTFQVEESTYFATLDFACHVAAFCLAGNDISCNRKVQLTEFFFQRHFVHQVIDEGVHLGFIALSLCHGGAEACCQQGKCCKNVFVFICLSLFNCS